MAKQLSLAAIAFFLLEFAHAKLRPPLRTHVYPANKRVLKLLKRSGFMQRADVQIKLPGVEHLGRNADGTITLHELELTDAQAAQLPNLLRLVRADGEAASDETGEDSLRLAARVYSWSERFNS